MKRRRQQNGMTCGEDIWPIKKILTSSDVDITHPFLTLPRQPVEDHILVHLTLQEKDHLRTVSYVHLNVLDDSTGDAYTMKLKWRGSYYNLIGKWGKIVREKGLSMGMEMKMRWTNGLLQLSVPQQPNDVLPLAQFDLPLQEFQEWPIKKVLTFSDVDTSHPFLPLSRQSVEEHITVHLTQQELENLGNDEQVDVNALDHDTGDMYVMKLKLRGNHYNLIGKWGKIIRRKGLGVGREIKLRWANRCLYFSVPLDRNASVPKPLEQWPIKKALTLSDIDTNHPFLTLPGKAVEDHILLHWTQEAHEKLRKDRLININAQDVDTGNLYAMKLSWRGSYYNLIGKWGKIVREKELTVGKEIRMGTCFLTELSEYPYAEETTSPFYVSQLGVPTWKSTAIKEECLYIIYSLQRRLSSVSHKYRHSAHFLYKMEISSSVVLRVTVTTYSPVCEFLFVLLCICLIKLYPSYLFYPMIGCNKHVDQV